MARKVECSKCHKRYLVDDEVVGKKFRCKVCGAVFVIPEIPDDLLELLREDDPPAEQAAPKKRKKRK